MNVLELIRQAHSSDPPDPNTPSPELTNYIDQEIWSAGAKVIVEIVPCYELDYDRYDWDPDLYLDWIYDEISEERSDELSKGAPLNTQEELLFRKKIHDEHVLPETIDVSIILRVDSLLADYGRCRAYLCWHGRETGSQHSDMVKCTGPFCNLYDALQSVFNSFVFSEEIVLREGELEQGLVLQWLDNHGIKHS